MKGVNTCQFHLQTYGTFLTTHFFVCMFKDALVYWGKRSNGHLQNKALHLNHNLF